MWSVYLVRPLVTPSLCKSGYTKEATCLLCPVHANGTLVSCDIVRAAVIARYECVQRVAQECVP
eukprot:4884927-Prymnesium_polylepis.2